MKKIADGIYKTVEGNIMTLEAFIKHYGSEIKVNQTSESMKSLSTPIIIEGVEYYNESALKNVHDVGGFTMNT